MLLGAVAIVAAIAAPVRADDQYRACIDATGKNDEWAKCGGELIGREEARMDGFWKRLMEVTEGATTEQLKAEQDAWAQYRKAACAFYTDQAAFGREGQVLSYPSCVADTVRARAEQLRAYLREIDP